ncbi:hypothetical protein Pmani_022047 [Petrolisthes manimaculis]|uniref:Uncharacterized protein n=1 Tax=Petrolisthes manimaculis TaxID=1843537 RepID=A0AAE1PFB5_9EUCA|nr:hypothetical protein Pmani_022047 [Petrolisthes manimaculis]
MHERPHRDWRRQRMTAGDREEREGRYHKLQRKNEFVGRHPMNRQEESVKRRRGRKLSISNDQFHRH